MVIGVTVYALNTLYCGDATVDYFLITFDLSNNQEYKKVTLHKTKVSISF